MTTISKHEQMGQKLGQLREELKALGFETEFFYRKPGSAKDPVAYLLIGDTIADVEEARGDKRV